MTEKEYINATNLANLRTAIRILGDVVPMHGVKDTELREAASKVVNLIEKLEPLVTTGRHPKKQKDD